MPMRSGGGVLAVSTLQLIVGIVFLGLYEGYKHKYILHQSITATAPGGGKAGGTQDYASESYASAVSSFLGFFKPMVWLFPLSVVNNVFALLGFAGMFGRIRQLIVAFFVYNVVNVVVSFHVFVDVANAVATVGLHGSLTGYERAAAAFLFFDFLLSLTACVFGIKALDELREKKRDDTRGSIEMGMPM